MLPDTLARPGRGRVPPGGLNRAGTGERSSRSDEATAVRPCGPTCREEGVTTSDVNSLGGERRSFRVVQDIRFDERDRMVEAWLSMED